MNWLLKKVEKKLNDLSIMRKLTLLYVMCVLVPLVLTDGVVLTIILQGERAEQKYEMENVASAVQSDLTYTFEEAAKMANSLYIDRSINEFLEKRYESGVDYFKASAGVMEKTFYEISSGTQNTNVIMYSDNETIVNGNHFHQISSVKEEEWYQTLQYSGGDILLIFYYIGEAAPTSTTPRKVSVIRKLDYYKDLPSEKLVKIDLDYSTIVRRLNDMKFNMPVYLCKGNQILFSNVGYSGNRTQFSYLPDKIKIDKKVYEREFNIYGSEMRILVMPPEDTVFTRMEQYTPLILFLLAVNILLPLILARMINRSFTVRLFELGHAFEQIDAESIKEIEEIQGHDEISGLMRNYNRMVVRFRELIKTVYIDRLERQKMDMARQNAELLALHSQINPHFLFNVLESIRMHSVLKGEEETASMIERLAVLERQNVQWRSDYVTISEELQFIEAYLELQKYRFGNKLSYEIEVEKECERYVLPKLTLVTFVENACVHGAEKKAMSCWIYVRIYRKNDMLCIEVEDTGDGMEEDAVEAFLYKMRTCSIEELMGNKHVGMMNACLRLRMSTDERAEFELESEKGVGTYILIKVPLEVLKQE